MRAHIAAVVALYAAVVALDSAIVALYGAVLAFNRSVATFDGTIVAFDSAIATLYAAMPSFAGSDAGGAVTIAATEVTTVPTVVHAIVLSVRGTEVVAVSVIVSVTANSVPGVSTAIGHIEVRTSEVEVVAVRVTGIDAEVPVAGVPVQRTIEIGGCDESVPLPVEQDIAQIEVATLPIGSIHVVTAGDTHQVVEVDLIGGLILFVCEIQLVSHLVGQEQGFVAGLLVAHCVC